MYRNGSPSIANADTANGASRFWNELDGAWKCARLTERRTEKRMPRARELYTHLTNFIHLYSHSMKRNNKL